MSHDAGLRARGRRSGGSGGRQGTRAGSSSRLKPQIPTVHLWSCTPRTPRPSAASPPRAIEAPMRESRVLKTGSSSRGSGVRISPSPPQGVAGKSTRTSQGRAERALSASACGTSVRNCLPRRSPHISRGPSHQASKLAAASRPLQASPWYLWDSR
jgi:hypothetical protein